MSKYNPEFGYGGNYDDNEPTPPERYSEPAKPADEFDSDIEGFKSPEERITEGMDHIPPSIISHGGGLPPSVFRTHIETSGEGKLGFPELAPEDLAAIKKVLRWANERFPNPETDDPEDRPRTKKYSVDGIGPAGKQVLWSHPEGSEQLPPSWVTLPPEPNDVYGATRRTWEALQGAPASGEEDVDPGAYSGLIERWTDRFEALGGLGLSEPPEPQQELGDQ